MKTVLGIPISDRKFKAWATLLVYPYAPFFLNEELRARVPTLHLRCDEFGATIQDLSFHDSFATYNVAPEINWVALLSSAAFNNLPENIKLELLQLQAKFGRGQIYNLDDYKTLLKDNELRSALKSTFAFEGKRMLELNHALWHGFSFETQQRWLEKFISEDRSECLSGTLSKGQWQTINKHYPAIKQLLGFAEKSGANCFATTLATMLDVEQAKHISGLWLQAETFLRTIQEHGYKRTELEPNENPSKGSILVWENNSLQHACFYLGDGLVFNKDAQGWFAPRQILSLEQVLENWKEFEVHVYARK
jgi:hypothetical protein